MLRKARIVCLDTLGDRVGALANARIFADQVGSFAPTGSTVGLYR